LLFVPALAVLLFKQQQEVKPVAWLVVLENSYQRLLFWSLNHSKTIFMLVIALVTLTAVLAPKLGTEFVPELEEGTLNVRVTLAPTASLATALTVAPKLESILLGFPEVNYALSRIGRPELGGDPEPVNNIEIYVGLKDRKYWQSAANRVELQQKMRQKLEQFPGLLFTFSQPIATRVDELLSGVKAQLAIKLFGADLDVLEEKGLAIEQVITTIQGTEGVALEQVAGEAQLVITPNRQQLSRFGLAVADVMSLIKTGLGGSNAGQIIQGNERYDIYVRFAEKYRQDIQSIKKLKLQSPAGAWVQLSDVAEVEIVSGPPQIRRDDVQRRVVIQANVQGRDMGSVVSEIQQRIAEQVDLPTGYSIAIGGQFESQQRAKKSLMIVVPSSILLIVLLLYLTFGSIGKTLLVILNVPLAMIGGVMALYISGQYLSVPSAVGFITLFGVAVLNGVVLVESIHQQCSKGNDVLQAVIKGTVSRLRPVLMTAITSALGLLPILLSNGIGSEIQKPLATVIVGGLVTSTLLTLVLLPVMYKKFLLSH